MLSAFPASEPREREPRKESWKLNESLAPSKTFRIVKLARTVPGAAGERGRAVSRRGLITNVDQGGQEYTRACRIQRDQEKCMGKEENSRRGGKAM